MSLLRISTRTLAPLFRDRTNEYRRLRLESCLRLVFRGLQRGDLPRPPLLRAMRCAWGNLCWRADSDFLLATLFWWQRSNGAVLECGSGLSTLLLATAARAHRRELHSLEHDASWAKEVESVLPGWLRNNARIHHTPMRPYGDYDWYDVQNVIPDEPIGFVVCDGPPGRVRGGRYGLVPLLRDRFAPGAIILLDDAQRRMERRVVDLWRDELPARVIDRTRTHVVLQSA